MRPRQKFNAPLWPFWLLVAAWFCANVPPTTVFHACHWLKGAEHFSHSSELKQSVAALLSGRSQSAQAQVSAPPVAPRAQPPALPAGAAVKKTDLALLAGPLRLIASLPSDERPLVTLRLPAAPVAEVPYPPPRGAGLV